MIAILAHTRWRHGAAGLLVVGAVFIALVLTASPAVAVNAPGWRITSLAQPTNFAAGHVARCEAQTFHCDSYTLLVTNASSREAMASNAAPIVIADTLPSGVTPVSGGIRGANLEFSETGNGAAAEDGFHCTTTPLQCLYEKPVPPNGALLVRIPVIVSASSGPLTNSASVQGGGDGFGGAATSAQNEVSADSPPFGLQDAGLAVGDALGALDAGAADHPYEVTTSFEVNSTSESLSSDTANRYNPVEELKDVAVTLPLGLVGNPTVTPRCREVDIMQSEGTTCPAASRVGLVTINNSESYKTSLNKDVTALYNLVPEAGYPAEFGFNILGRGVTMFATVVPSGEGSGYAVRVVAPDIPRVFRISGVSVTFFGDPSTQDGGANEAAAFFRNPSRCTNGAVTARIEADSWPGAGRWASTETVAYPQLTGCELLRFDPSIDFTPTAQAAERSVQADEPSGYVFDLNVPQTPNVIGLHATPDLKDASVTLPAGVGVSPAAADGLEACTEAQIGLRETETGQDGFAHPAAGHCPLGSRIGEVEVETPLLAPHTLNGHVYLATPQCGGAGQPACEASDALDGKLFGLYLEISGAGVIVKLKGEVSVDPSTGRLSVRFVDSPQLPFSDLKVRLDGGARAPLASPQSCGSGAAWADLTPWSAPATPDAVVASRPLTVVGCPSGFAPGFLAESENARAGAFTPFSVTFSKKTAEPELSGLQLTTPAGLVGMLSKVPLCGEPQAQAGGCSTASRIGTATVASGSGTHPLWLHGEVYLTSGYKGAPFGLSIVVPAVAGPFNLGNVVVRAAINVDPRTTALTITSDPLPQLIDGVQTRIQTVSVSVDRADFLFNPTNCGQLHVGGTIAAVTGAASQVSSPFAASDCRSLPFKPLFSVLTSAKHSRANGASMHVVVKSGAGQANIASVKVNLPKQLPSRNSTLKLACLAATFAANPAACPAGSKVGSATAYTPVLPVALKGPAYFVSHGGAKFPELVVVLQGDGVTVDLAGETFISKAGITSSTFRSVPDVPITRFDLVLPIGADSALSGNGNFCKGAMYMPTQIKGQNGAVVKQSTKVAVSGCPKPKPARKARTSGGPHNGAGRHK